MPSLTPIVDAYQQAVQFGDQRNQAQVQQATGLQALLAHVQAQQKAQRASELDQQMRRELATSDGSQESLAKIAAKYSSAGDILKSQTSSLDRKAQIDATKEAAKARLSQGAAQFDRNMEIKARNATTAEERAAVDQQWKQGRMQFEAAHLNQTGERLLWETGIASPKMVAPTIAPAARPMAMPGGPAPGSFEAARLAEQAGTEAPLSDAFKAGAPAPRGLADVLKQVAPQSGEIDPMARVRLLDGERQADAAPANNLDARDLMAAGSRAAPVVAPIAPTAGTPAPAATTAAPPAPKMPEFFGSPREIAQAKNKWLMDQARAAQKQEINLSGGRESQQNNRIISAGNQVAAALKNITDVPIAGASSGIFGERGHPKGIMGAGKETIANAMTTQEVNDYKIMATGIERSLAAIESSGLAATGALTSQMGSVVWREGWTNFSKLRALAETRQIVEKGMEVQLANPRVPPETKELVRKIVKEVQDSVPFTHSDLTKLAAEQAVDPKITLGDVVKFKRRASDAQPAGEWSIRPR